MKSVVSILGLGLIIVLGLHGLGPVFGFEDGLVPNWVVVVLVLALIPLGARMAILKQRSKRKAKNG